MSAASGSIKLWSEKIDDGVDSYGEQQDVELHFIQPNLPSFVSQCLSSAFGPERRDVTRLAATDNNKINPTIPRAIPVGIL